MITLAMHHVTRIEVRDMKQLISGTVTRKIILTSEPGTPNSEPVEIEVTLFADSADKLEILKG